MTKYAFYQNIFFMIIINKYTNIFISFNKKRLLLIYFCVITGLKINIILI